MRVKLSEVLKSLESGGRPKGGGTLNTAGIPSLGAEHLNSFGGFNFKSVKYIPEVYFENLNSGKIESENILIVKDGATTGKVSYVNNDFPFNSASVMNMFSY
jgi:type I restriction enzyme S subunit